MAPQVPDLGNEDADGILEEKELSVDENVLAKMRADTIQASIFVKFVTSLALTDLVVTFARVDTDKEARKWPYASRHLMLMGIRRKTSSTSLSPFYSSGGFLFHPVAGTTWDIKLNSMRVQFRKLSLAPRAVPSHGRVLYSIGECGLRYSTVPSCGEEIIKVIEIFAI